MGRDEAAAGCSGSGAASGGARWAWAAWLLAAGGALVLCAMVALAEPLPRGWSGAVRPELLVAAGALGLLGRGVRRKVALGRAVTWHQALSFEFVLQAAQAVGPLRSARALEGVFVQREAGLADARVARWLDVLRVGTPVLVLGSLAAVALALGAGATGALLSAAALGALGLGARRHGLEAAEVAAVLVGGLVLGLEGACFVAAVDGCLPVPHAVVAFVLFVGALELSPFPAGLGWAELPALAFGERSAQTLWCILLFHGVRLVTLLAGALVYLPRYKLGFRDLGDPATVAAMRSSLRPPGGWPNPEPAVPGAPRVSIVIPAYNEEARLPAFMDTVRAYLDARPAVPMEVLVVDDGSRDRTAALVESVAREDARVRLVRQVPNQGKGAAVRRGVLEARGDHVLFVDADGATPIAELDRVLAAAGRAEVVIGSRTARSADVERHREGLRSIMSGVFYGLVNLFAVPGVGDTQCGFKLFRRDAARRLFSVAEEKGWAFDVEVLYLAQLAGFAIVEVPVNWQAIEGSKVSPFRDAVKMFRAIFRIRRRHAGFCRALGQNERMASSTVA